MRRFLVKKTGDCGSPPTTNKPKADSERLAAAREYEDRRRRGFKAASRDEFAWLTYEPAPADSDSNGAQVGAPAATGSASSDDTTTKPQAQPLSQYKMFCTPCRASYGVSASMRLPDRGLFRKYSKGPFVIGGTNMKRTTLTAHEASDGHSVAVDAIHAWNVTGHRSRRPNYQTSSCSSSTVGHAHVSDSESQGSSSDEGQ